MFQAALIQSSAKERDTAAKLKKAEQAMREALETFKEMKASEQAAIAESTRLGAELQAKEQWPWKLAGLKKCNKCKKYCWDGTGKFCINMGCSTNVKTLAEASTQTGEDEEDVIVDENRFEEVPYNNQDPTAEHEARMMAWREASEAAAASAAPAPSAETAAAAPSAASSTADAAPTTSDTAPPSTPPTAEAAQSAVVSDDDDVLITGQKPAKKRRLNTLIRFV